MYSAPAKVILFGEHAVVYGQPAIAVPVSALRAVASTQPGSGLHIVAQDLGKTLPIDISKEVVDDSLALIVKLVLQTLKRPLPDLTITLASQIPMASGLGSGAAVAAALARALSGALGQPLDNNTLNSLIYEVEKTHHGTPSGIDNTVIVYEQPVYFVRGQPPERLIIRQPFTLVVADTGKSALTHVAVGDVRQLYDAQPARIQPVLDSIGALVKDARGALESGDTNALGPLMLRNHAYLKQLTVSSPELDTLVDAAMQAGALGAKLSGGGRGGNMIALVTPETQTRVEKALLRAGAVRAFSTLVS
ncbi:MAG: mevalonate kinase [Chloroflexi bacterium]|nr:mevalonate kinase [Chloroflexota bacterium]